ncbi:hypothetical protein J6Y73_04680 [bacterium]|nr:hypothetical protein [bacterium]
MKKLFAIITSLLLFLSFSLTGCGKGQENVTRVEMDINPSVEFMVDAKGKVSSVTALNDDGSILISGETFVGLKYEDAMEKAVELSVSLGYISDNESVEAKGEIKISVSGDASRAKEIQTKINSTVDKYLKDNNVNAKVEEAKAMTLEELRREAVNTSMVTEEEAKSMDESQCLKVICASRIETAELITKEMREAYYRAKEYKIEFAEKEEVANAMKDLTGIYQTAYSLYKTALDAYSQAIQRLDEARYNYLVSPESDYQKALATLREKKVEFVKERNYCLSLDVNGEEYIRVSASLKVTEEEYDQMVESLERLGSSINSSLETLIQALKTAETALNEAYNKLPLPSDFEETLKSKAKETEENINKLKDSYFEEFEKAHKSDFKALEKQISDQKKAMLENVKSNNSSNN